MNDQRKICKSDFIKTETLYMKKGHYQESEKTAHRMVRIFARYLSVMGFVSRICKELLQSTIKTHPNLKMGKSLNRYFCKKIYKQPVSKQMARCSTSLVMQNMQTKTMR